MLIGPLLVSRRACEIVAGMARRRPSTPAQSSLEEFNGATRYEAQRTRVLLAALHAQPLVQEEAAAVLRRQGSSFPDAGRSQGHRRVLRPVLRQRRSWPR